MTTYWWRNWMIDGGSVIGGPFDSPHDAGVWRRDNTPLIFNRGPTLVKHTAGEWGRCTPAELTEAFTQFAAKREQLSDRLDLTPEATEFP